MFSKLRMQTASFLAVMFLFVGVLGADEPEKPTLPKIALCHPLLLEPNSTTEVVIRGWYLVENTEIQCDLEGVLIKVLKQEAATVPGRQDAQEVGDTQLRVEITTPEISSPTRIHLLAKNTDGQSQPHPMLLGSSLPIADDQERNDGFRDAQTIGSRQTLRGEIHQDRNVDVFAIEGNAGQSLKLNLCARELGSAMDGLITVYDESGKIIASNDDVPNSDPRIMADAKLQLTLPNTGRFFLCLQDAHDRGGPAHPWILHVELTDD